MTISGFDYAPPSAETKASNARFMRLCAEYLNHPSPLPRREEVHSLSRTCGLSEKEAYAHLLAAGMGLDPTGADRALFHRYLLPSLQPLRTEDFEKDPYIHAVRFFEKKIGNRELKRLTLPALTPFVANDLRVEQDGRLLPALGYFEKEYRYPALLENGREWMTLLPIEQVTMKKPIAASHGRVLTYGLGLGYFLFHAMRKPEVTSVTVVEHSEDAIKLFEETLLPCFPYREKLRIVKEDAFHYAEHLLQPDAYDFVFADIWHDAGDGRDAYLRLLAAEQNKGATRFSYWLEDTILCYIDGALWP